jgi:hypothetical protein
MHIALFPHISVAVQVMIVVPEGYVAVALDVLVTLLVSVQMQNNQYPQKVQVL